MTWTLKSGKDTVTIAAKGAVVTSWRIEDSRGETRELIDGYASNEELDQLAGYRSAVLAPWSNRICDARYSFDGADYDLGPDPDGMRQGLHGLVADVDFVELESADDYVQLACQVRRCDAYPFGIQVHVLYRLWGTDGLHRLEVVIKAANTGDTDAPCSLGWHPYIRYQGPRELTSLTIPAASVVATNAVNIPLPADAAFVPVDEAVTRVFTEDQRVSAVSEDVVIQAPAHLDHAFTDLRRADDEWVRGGILFGDGSEMDVEFLPENLGRGVGIFQVFTGEPLGERAGEAVAFEPCLAMTDAFNRDECADAVRLAPGQMRSLRAALSFRDNLA